jgi:hypothetical protein
MSEKRERGGSLQKVPAIHRGAPSGVLFLKRTLALSAAQDEDGSPNPPISGFLGRYKKMTGRVDSAKPRST